jgi:hypothetical protein
MGFHLRIKGPAAGRQITMMNDVPVFYDCEATCIGGLPIEIGWAFTELSTGEIQSESHLIKPPLHWDMHIPYP